MNSMKINLRTVLLLGCAVIAAFLISFSASAGDLHVDDDAPGGDGSTWLLAMNNLQTALLDLDLAPGDTIKVAQGIYKPGIVQEASFNVPLEVILKGGYVGYNAPDPELRDPELYETILTQWRY